jgi:hypothetical protein
MDSRFRGNDEWSLPYVASLRRCVVSLKKAAEAPETLCKRSSHSLTPAWIPASAGMTRGRRTRFPSRRAPANAAAK